MMRVPARKLGIVRAIAWLNETDFRSFPPMLGWFVVLALLDISVQWLATHAFGVPIGFLSLLARIPILYIAFLIPSFGNFGTRELVWASLFSDLHPPREADRLRLRDQRALPDLPRRDRLIQFFRSIAYAFAASAGGGMWVLLLGEAGGFEGEGKTLEKFWSHVSSADTAWLVCAVGGDEGAGYQALLSD